MNKQSAIVTILTAIIVVGVGYIFLNQNVQPSTSSQNEWEITNKVNVSEKETVDLLKEEEGLQMEVSIHESSKEEIITKSSEQELDLKVISIEISTDGKALIVNLNNGTIWNVYPYTKDYSGPRTRQMSSLSYTEPHSVSVVLDANIEGEFPYQIVFAMQNPDIFQPLISGIPSASGELYDEAMFERVN